LNFFLELNRASVHVLLHAEMEYTAAGTRSYETLSEVTKMAVAADVYTLLQGLEAGAAYLCRPQERKENASPHLRARAVVR